jgi:hypothetical protein
MLDVSRGLRVDERNLSKAASGDVGPGRPEPPGTMVFCGDPVRVREGFALALHAMGIAASMTGVIVRDQPEEGE